MKEILTITITAAAVAWLLVAHLSFHPAFN
jgi:hypothetical protein